MMGSFNPALKRLGNPTLRVELEIIIWPPLHKLDHRALAPAMILDAATKVRLRELDSKGAKASAILAHLEQRRLAYLRDHPKVSLPTLDFPCVVVEPNGTVTSASLDEVEEQIDGRSDLHWMPGMCVPVELSGNNRQLRL